MAYNFGCRALYNLPWRASVGSVEFALHPQHEACCDSEIQKKKVLKRKFRKQLGRLSIISLNSQDKEEAFESQR